MGILDRQIPDLESSSRIEHRYMGFYVAESMSMLVVKEVAPEVVRFDLTRDNVVRLVNIRQP